MPKSIAYKVGSVVGDVASIIAGAGETTAGGINNGVRAMVKRT